MRPLETEIVSCAKSKLEAFSSALAATGRTHRGPEITVWCGDLKAYTSEIKIEIIKNGQIDDVLEFHIFRDGEPIVTSEEAEAWFHQELAKMVPPAEVARLRQG